jgi:hypothetical protein
VEIIRSNKPQGIFDFGAFDNPYTIVDTPFLILDANPNRVKFAIANVGADTVYIDYVDSVSNDDYSFALLSGARYIEENFVYGGDIYVATATGDSTDIVVDEFTPSPPPSFDGVDFPIGDRCATYLVTTIVEGVFPEPFPQTLAVTGRILGVAIFPYLGQTNYTVMGERQYVLGEGECVEPYWVSYVLAGPGLVFYIDSIVLVPD